MREIINKIIEKNFNLFGESPIIEKIDIGFTNTIYKIDDSYIVKICTNIDNEENFRKEIEFYKANKENDSIPKLYFSDTDKKDIPYFYEIIKKIEGISLYNVWHTFSESQREDVIKQLCEAMKQMHNNVGFAYDWANYIKDQYTLLNIKAKELDIFNEDDKRLLDHAFSKFDKYLKSDDFVLIHNDLHFNNVFINNGKIKIIDFERSIYAPRDFELDIIYRMIRKPWKFASEETEQYTDSSQYSNIMFYIQKYYPKLIDVPYLYQRLAIYDIVYFLKQLIKNSEIEELKDDVISATKIVALEYELNFDNVKTK